MSESSSIPPAFDLLERSELFSFLRSLIQQVYRPSVKTMVHDYGLIIVGGQSLALWARQYLINDLTGEDVGFVTSDDLDFIGNNTAVDYCATVMGISFRRATLDDNTPNLAIGVIDWKEGEQLVVDILKKGSVGGVDQKEIMKHLAVIDLEGVDVAVIDPVTCLKSRIFNLFAPWQHDSHRESVRVKVAIRASACYIRELLVFEGFRIAADQIRRIKALALSGRGKRVFVEYGINILDAIPNDPDLFPSEYLALELPKMVQQVTDVRRLKLLQYRRFGTTPIHASHDAARHVPDVDPR